MKPSKSIPLAALFAVLAATALAQSPPDLMNYQGTLLQPSGQPEIGPKTLEFRIVDEGNTTVWGPQTFPDLPLHQGKFNVLLGTTDDTGTTITLAFQGPGDAARYMSVRVAGEPTERLPLQRIASVPWAAIAGSLPPLMVYTARINGGADFSLNDDPVGRPADPQGVRIEIPGLKITMPISNSGRPIRVGLRKAKNVNHLFANPDIYAAWYPRAGGTDSYVSASIGVEVSGADDFRESNFIWSLPGYPSNTEALSRNTAQFGSFNYLIEPPEGASSVTLTMKISYHFLAHNFDSLIINGGCEMYAYQE